MNASKSLYQCTHLIFLIFRWILTHNVKCTLTILERLLALELWYWVNGQLSAPEHLIIHSTGCSTSCGTWTLGHKGHWEWSRSKLRQASPSMPTWPIWLLSQIVKRKTERTSSTDSLYNSFASNDPFKLGEMVLSMIFWLIDAFRPSKPLNSWRWLRLTRNQTFPYLRETSIVLRLICHLKF